MKGGSFKHLEPDTPTNALQHMLHFAGNQLQEHTEDFVYVVCSRLCVHVLQKLELSTFLSAFNFQTT